ncbi:hypothetical protein TRICHSKD4_2294 [Roseibium sp. TrichSKD4]|uniref:hypothetical protein n=1 Tax=Roseibium sp. TrichSKD4 TaxID=744980 RepID=UPI0001E569BC|nr:hypothetical protein [Roseibium sp. TrichSKD4]EFO32495.1 hypothetical protein TRICHSKD4_2294 [Roseibium sp. TrichSKD4]
MPENVPEKKTYPVIAAVRHDGVRYAPDDPDRNTISLSAKEAEVLLKLKAIGPEKADEAKDASTADPDADDDNGNDTNPPAPEGDERKATIKAAFEKLDPDRDFTQAGKPKVKAIESAVGFDVNGDEVAALWEEARPTPTDA